MDNGGKQEQNHYQHGYCFLHELRPPNVILFSYYDTNYDTNAQRNESKKSSPQRYFADPKDVPKKEYQILI